MIRIAVPTEVRNRERRVALTPSAAATLVARGHLVFVEAGAGRAAGFRDAEYADAGATVADRDAVIGSAGVITVVDGPRPDRAVSDRETRSPMWPGLGDQHTVIGLHDSLWRPENAAKLATSGATVLDLELMPRITRAQSMDVLSSMATVVGYRAALLAATTMPRMMPLMMTAAGTIPAARVLVLGAGVAGLQAIATARRLGAIVAGYDIRPAAAEQIRSLGARAIEIEPGTESPEDQGGYARQQSEEASRAQRELLAPHVADADAVISTAAVPGARSPELITAPMVEAMRPGSVIVDLGAERGGNCRLTRPDEVVTHCEVTVLGPTDLASRSAGTSSRLFAQNLVNYLEHLETDGELVIDRSDEITAGTLVAIGGQVVHPRVADLLAVGDRPGCGQGPGAGSGHGSEAAAR